MGVSLYDTLKKYVSIVMINNAKTEITIRCPFCGDSRNIKHAHFGIKATAPHLYKCFKCHAAGIFTYRTLRLLKVHDVELSMYLADSTDEYFQNAKFKKVKSIKRGIMSLPPYIDNAQQRYFERRMGIVLSEDDIVTYNMVSDFRKFFMINKMERYIDIDNNQTKAMFKNIADNAIGFMSHDRNTISFRHIYGSFMDNKRYFIQNITGADEIDKSFILNMPFDFTCDKFELIVTEGIFDIIGVFNHVYNKETKPNRIYMSINGKDFNSGIYKILRAGLLDIDVFIYSDSDVSRRDYYDMLGTDDILKNLKYRLFYNKRGKDFGVRKEEIELVEFDLNVKNKYF